MQQVLTTTTPMKNNGNMKFLLIFVFSFFSIVGACAHVLSNRAPEEEVITPAADHEKPPKPVIVAVIDTGFDFESTWSDVTYLKKPRVCKYGHKDFTGLGLKDSHGHGTHIAGLIAQYADKANYCLVILKYYHTEKDQFDHLRNSVLAFQRAIDLKVSVINYSGGGIEKSEIECLLMKKALNMGIVVIAAAGNEGSDINKKPYYPAMCDSRIITVGNLENNGMYAKSSNYSNSVELEAKGMVYEKGVRVLSTLPNNSDGLMTGTSQAAAIRTGKIVNDLDSP